MRHIFIKPILILLAIVAFSSKSVNAQIDVTDSMTATQLVQTLVGTGISFANPVLRCAQHASGTFTVTASNLGLTGGIILTSGNAETDPGSGRAGADGPQDLWFPSECNETDPETSPGSDPNLDSLIPGIGTHDACILEFDFVPDGDSLLFDYVFGSEEYDGFSCCSVNDAFGFFLSGPGLTGNVNIATIPGTNIPVSINSTTDINLNGADCDITLCTSLGPGSPFGQYYNNNSIGQSITYFGMTQVLTARAAVIPCTTYHIKLAIADGGDCVLDSGVFLEANSFRSTDIKLNLKSTLEGKDDYLVEGCTEGTITVKRNTPFPIPQTVLLSYTGNATHGTDYNNPPTSVTIPANDTIVTFVIIPTGDNIVEGTENIVINVLNPCNGNVMDSAIIPILEFLPITLLNDDTFMCGAQPVLLNVAGDPDYTYTWTSNPASRIDNANTMHATGFPDSTTVYTIKGTYFDCATEALSLTAVVEPEPIVDILNTEEDICLGAPLKLRVKVGPEYYSDYSYLWFPPTGLTDPFIKEPEFFVTTPGKYNFVLAVQTATLGCVGTDTFALEVKPAAVLTDVTPDFTLKYGDQMQLNASGVEYYMWYPTKPLDYPNTHNPKATGWDPTTFTVIGLNEFGCYDTAYVKMDIDYSMFEYMPSAFTPNGDGRNDLFGIHNFRYQRLIEFRIFNRWGQEVFTTTDYKQGWDGTFKGVPQETGVYNYIIRVAIPNGQQRMYKGDVTLVR